MRFYNRKKEINEIKAILSEEPNFVYFVYGPINSGKTTLLTRVFEELPENYVVFYFNFRGFNIQEVGDLIRVLFEVEYGKGKEAVKEILKEFLKKGKKVIEEPVGIPIPEKLFDYLFGKEKKSEDVFRYLEQLFREVVRNKKRPVFVLDELQSIKEVLNTAGRPLIYELFNFMVRLTKETHLCHCFCATSDCLFIEDVYSNARLEGRAEYILVDDLDKERAFEVYEEFGFEDKELVWDYIGGKFSDMIKLFERKKRGEGEREALLKMFKDERARLEILFRSLKYSPLKVRVRDAEVMVDVESFKEGLKVFQTKAEVSVSEIEEPVLLGGIEENVLFYNPVEGIVRPQSRLIWRAIKELES